MIDKKALSDVKQDDYETWYEEAIIASNNAGFAGMSAAQVIEYQDGEIKCLRADVSALVKALSALRGCIVETRGPDAHSALELADAALAAYCKQEEPSDDNQ